MRILLFTLLLSMPLWCLAQPGYIKIIAGNGGPTYSGDGYPATNAAISWPKGIATDPWGNTYIHDGGNGRIRKITPDGIISTIAGGGTSTADGILALDANIAAFPTAGWPGAVAIDHSGNVILIDNGRVRKVTITTGIITTLASISAKDIYIDASDNIYVTDGNYIRKINTAGVVTIVAGTGVGSFSGDGGLATAATINNTAGICGDAAGNLYIADRGNNRIRKIDATGIISTIAGTGSATFSGDGGLATMAAINQPLHLRKDSYGNLFFVDSDNDRIRKISPAGIISTVAGAGAWAPTVSGVPATNSYLFLPNGLGIDANDNVYITDQGQNYAFMLDNIGGAPIASADSFEVYLTPGCTITEFTIKPLTSNPAHNVKTWFGDGLIQTGTCTYSGTAWFTHAYYYPAKFTVKHVLYNGLAPIDSVTYPFTYQFCRSIPLKVFVDNNFNCSYDIGIDGGASLPIRLAVDSAGVPIDTVPCTGNMYYNARGPLGTVYTFRPINVAPGVVVSCPSSGALNHALSSYINTPTAHIGLNCTTTPGYDLRLFTNLRAGANRADVLIIADNLYCTPPAAIISMGLNPKYNVPSAFSYPPSVIGTQAQWSVNTLSSIMSTPYTIRGKVGRNPSIVVSSGDTMLTNYIITPTSGDANPSDNVVVRIDTIDKSYDPNDISVTPVGCLINSQTKLTYTIRFENTGTDTAFHIYILDTLPPEVESKSMRIEAASDAMSTYIKKAGVHTIVRFDFPDINLPDSSHHGLNTGMIVYSINRNPSLPEGASIRNRVGIYFDDNPPVLTNTAENTIGCPITSVSEVAGQGRAEIYPNPATNELIIKTNGNEYHSCTITNSIGQILLRENLDGTHTKLNISNLPAGLYYVTLRGAQTEVHKVVKR